MFPKDLMHIVRSRSLRKGLQALPQIIIRTVFSQNNTQESILLQAIEKVENNAEVNWDEIKQQTIKSGDQIKEKNIDAITLGFCINHSHFKAGKAFFKYLNKKNQELNIATIGKSFRLFYFLKKSSLATIDDEITALELYDKLRAKYKLLDAITAEHAIYTLSQTNRWKECLELFEMIKITASPGAHIFSCIIETAFNNNEEELGWKLMEEMLDKDSIKGPLDEVYFTWINKYANNSVQNLEKLLNYFADFDIKPSKSVVDSLTSISKKLGFSPHYTKINKKSRSETSEEDCNMTVKTLRVKTKQSGLHPENYCTKGFCENCNAKLQKVNLKEEEFNLLRSSILDNVIVGKDVYLKTTPEELANFNRFIDISKGKYNVVIDGLNVAYSVGVRQPPKVCAQFVDAVVRYWIERGKTVLVLGRAHMASWPMMGFVKKNTYMFLAQNRSQDDPLILYCALYGEPGTQIVSRDMMKAHAFRLKDTHLKRLFRRWLLQSRHEVLHIHFDTKNVHFKHPPLYLPSAQTCDSHWHVPYTADSSQNIDDNLWLCLRKNSPIK